MTVVQDDRPELSEGRLSDRLRARTRSAHDDAENATFVGRLMSGELPVAAYTAMVAQTYAIYSALESAAERWRDDPVAGPFVQPELTRVPSLERDLAYLLGPDWAPAAQRLRLPATERYVSHLADVAGSWPAGFVAHHYVRYLGDLSGGQIIRQRLQQHYGEVGVHAGHFYVFEDVPKLKPFRDRYGALLDEVVLPDEEGQRMVAEAVRAFEFNTAVFADLATIDLQLPQQPSSTDGGA